MNTIIIVSETTETFLLEAYNKFILRVGALDGAAQMLADAFDPDAVCK